MILCITEKPSVAQSIASILGASTRHQRYYEGNGYWVSWTYGHLCTLKEPADYTEDWKRWSLGSLPMIPPRFGIKLIENKNVEAQFETLADLIKKCDEIINCGDAGQEGELIQRWVMQKAHCNKPVKRLWISSLTDEAIREGFKNLKPEKELEPLYLAGLCRAIGDWILGINATRLYSLKYRTDRSQVLSIGRVQTPTLALIVNRDQEIENFQPKDYWELKTVYRDIIFSAESKSFEKEEDGNALVEKLKGKEFKVTDIKKKSGTEAPPKLFDLTSLQVECNKKLNMTAEETLKTAQSLYEKKATTYPRVDTTYLPEDIYPKCGAILNALTDYYDLFEPIKGKKLKKSKKVFDNSKITDHHAIIPTNQKKPSNLTETERKVYDLISRRFISVFFPDSKFEQTTVKGTVEKINFKTSAKVTKDPGWKIVYAKETQGATSDEEKDNQSETASQNLAILQEGETGPQKPFLAKKTTQPPKHYTEATLLRAMETAGAAVDDETLREALKANGIGRPSTRAAIIEILFKRGYVKRERKSLRATKAGKDLIAIIHEELLKSPKLTGMWEARLRAIEARNYSPDEFIKQLKQMIHEITLSVLQDTTNRRIESEAPPQKKPAKTKKAVSKNGKK